MSINSAVHNPNIDFYNSDFMTLGDSRLLLQIFDEKRVEKWDEELSSLSGRVLNSSQGNELFQKRGSYPEYIIWASWGYDAVGATHPVIMGRKDRYTEATLKYVTSRLLTIDRNVIFQPNKRFQIGSKNGKFSSSTFLFGGIRRVFRELNYALSK